MELDSLKDIWKNLDEEDLQPAREVPILSMLQKRSQSTISRLKRNLNRELIAVIVIYSLTIWYIITYQKLYSELAVLLALVGGAFLFYYYRKNKLLKQMQCVACEVRSNLKQQLVTLEKYVRFYFVAGTILTPLAYFAAGVIILFNAHDFNAGLNDVPMEAQTSVSQIPVVTHISNHRFFILFISIGAVVTVGSYFVNRWLINKMYGQHIQKLKELLYQMEEEG
jgi:branched-subunit amino acid transport protein AzlD